MKDVNLNYLIKTSLKKYMSCISNDVRDTQFPSPVKRSNDMGVVNHRLCYSRVIFTQLNLFTTYLLYLLTFTKIFPTSVYMVRMKNY